MSAGTASKAVEEAEIFCKENGIRFTEPRRNVLDIIAKSKKPLGAYDILDALKAYGGEDPKPPTAYRALEFLSEHGFIHRIESLNAYVACGSGHRHAGSQFLVCDSCGQVTEAHLCAVPADLLNKADGAGFVLSRWDAELHGTCKSCVSAGRA